MRHVLLPLAAVLLLSAPSARAGDGCALFGEIAVEAVKAKATEACFVTGHPVACAVAAALNSAAGDGLAKKGAEAGCNWTVEKVDKLLKVTIKVDPAGKKKEEVQKAEAEARKAETELKKAKGYTPKDK